LFLTFLIYLGYTLMKV